MAHYRICNSWGDNDTSQPIFGSDGVGIITAAFTYYYDPAILQNKLTPLSIFKDLALRK